MHIFRITNYITYIIIVKEDGQKKSLQKTKKLSAKQLWVNVVRRRGRGWMGRITYSRQTDRFLSTIAHRLKIFQWIFIPKHKIQLGKVWYHKLPQKWPPNPPPPQTLRLDRFNYLTIENIWQLIVTLLVDLIAVRTHECFPNST